MATIDPEQELQRLAALYASQTDGELESVAKQAHELTGEARETLRAELTKRGLYVGQLEEDGAGQGHEEAEFRNLVTIRTFWNLLEAQLAKGAVEAAGIDAFLFDDNMVRVEWLPIVLGGVKLRVDKDNVEAANRVLAESAASGEKIDESDSREDSPA